MTQSTPRHALRRHRLHSTSALGLGLLFALTACSGPAPAPSSTSATTAAPAGATTASPTHSSASGSPTASTAKDAYVPASARGAAKNVPKPVMPEAMKQETDEGAEAAVKYWFETVYYLQQTNDPKPMQEVSSEECEYCETFPSAIDQRYKTGGWHTGTRPEVVSSLEDVLDGKMTVTALVTLHPGAQYSTAETVVLGSETGLRARTPWTFHLTYDQDHQLWRVTHAEASGRGT